MIAILLLACCIDGPAWQNPREAKGVFMESYRPVEPSGLNDGSVEISNVVVDEVPEHDNDILQTPDTKPNGDVAAHEGDVAPNSKHFPAGYELSACIVNGKVLACSINGEPGTVGAEIDAQPVQASPKEVPWVPPSRPWAADNGTPFPDAGRATAILSCYSDGRGTICSDGSKSSDWHSK